MLGVAVVAGLMLTVGIVPAIAVTGAGAKGGIGLFQDLPQDLKITDLQQKTQIYAKDGSKEKLIASFYNQDRDVIGMQDVAATVKNATLAAEDVRFYQHGGVDPMGIVRAVAVDVLHKDSQGASTISQQYVKNVCVQEAELLPTQKQVTAAYDECTGGVQRKLKEARLAIGLEKKYSKDQILLGYLNIAGFGGQIYGIESAAQYYFDTHAKDLTPAQAASLMAMVNNPAVLRLDVKANYAANKVRRDYILKNERTHGMLDEAAYEQAVATKIAPKITPVKAGCAGAPSGAGYFCDYVVDTIRNDPSFGKTAAERYNKLQSAGWKIYTTLDLGLQKKAKSAMTAYVPAKSPSGTDLGGAATTVEVGTGRILSMVQSKRFDDTGGKGTGGAGYTATAVNWNTDQAYGGSGGFQPGSSYKTFTLIDWLEHGHGLNEVVDGDPRYVPSGALTACGKPAAGWDVHNDTGDEGGYQTVMAGTARSVNGVYASMGEKLDLCDIRSKAESLLVHPARGGELEDNPSSILGTNLISPLTMATAYAGIANKGTVCHSIAIDRIVASDGGTVPVPQADCARAIPETIAVAAGYALHGVLQGNGTLSMDGGASGSSWSFAKTGTTDEAKSTWAVGGTTKTVSAVFVGNVNKQITNLRYVPGYSSCGRAADARYCLWKDITEADVAKYPGDSSWPQPAAQYLYGQEIAVPDVSGKSLADAKTTLAQAGFQAKVGDRVASDEVDKGKVVQTDPAAGSEQVGGSVVTIHASSGPQAAQAEPGQAQQPGTIATVPDVSKMTSAEAQAALASAGFTKIAVTNGLVPGGAACQVDGQLPLANTQWDTSKQVGIDVGKPADGQTCP